MAETGEEEEVEVELHLCSLTGCRGQPADLAVRACAHCRSFCGSHHICQILLSPDDVVCPKSEESLNETMTAACQQCMDSFSTVVAPPAKRAKRAERDGASAGAATALVVAALLRSR